MLKASLGGYTPAEVCKKVGLGPQQLVDYAQKRVVIPSIRTANGQGSTPIYGVGNLVELATAKALAELGLSVRRVATVLDEIRRCWTGEVWMTADSLWLTVAEGEWCVLDFSQRARWKKSAPPAAVVEIKLDELRRTLGLKK